MKKVEIYILYSCTPDLGHGPQLKNGRQMKYGE